MKSNESTPSWVYPVDGATCAALSRELWEMLRDARVEMPVVDFADYIIGMTLAFQREYASAEWGVTHDWMEATEAFLTGYLRDYPIPALERAWESTFWQARIKRAGLPVNPEPAVSPVYATNVDDEAISYAERVDVLCDSGGRALVAMLQREGIPCVHYGDGDIVVLWGFTSGELRIHLYVSDGLPPAPDNMFADLFIVVPGAEEEYDTVAEGMTHTATVAAVKAILANVHAEVE